MFARRGVIETPRTSPYGEPMICTNCDSTLSKDEPYRFCPYCGTSLGATDGAADTVQTNQISDMSAEGADDTIRTEALPSSKAGTPKFSETRWFMAATKPEELSDAEPENYEDIDQMTDPYKSSDKLPKTVREKFSLSETAQHEKLKKDK